MTFFTELATNATNNDVRIITYVGNDDGISPHFGTEVTIQVRRFSCILAFFGANHVTEHDVRRHSRIYETTQYSLVVR